MKKNITYVLMFCISVFVFSQSIEWKVIKNTYAYDNNYFFAKEIKTGALVNPVHTLIYGYEDTPIPYDFGAHIKEADNYVINVEAVVPNRTHEFLHDEVLTSALKKEGKEWYSSDYEKILRSQNRNTALEYFLKGIQNYEQADIARDNPPSWWYKRNLVERCDLFQVVFNIRTFFDIAYFYILDIQNTNTSSELTVICEYWYMPDSKIPVELQPKKGEKMNLSLCFDGDYMDVIYKDVYLLGSFIAGKKELGQQLNTLIRTNTCDLTNVTFPRRADKNHRIGTSCIVAENLRLRKEESTTSATLHTMKAGTKVTILQLGKQQTIDGITANWVQVQLADDTRGWCFGGYLLEH